MVIDTIAGYLVLRRALPSFLHLVSTDLKLCTERKGDLFISLPRILTSSRYETRRFVFYDILCTLALGVAPLAEYDSSDSSIQPGAPLPLEGFHGIPFEWIVIIGDVHVWRAAHPGVSNETGWTSLELRTLAWHPRTVDISSRESIELVVRMAVQETWRHATLIYIYMVRFA
jgi:hypothetical protein